MSRRRQQPPPPAVPKQMKLRRRDGRRFEPADACRMAPPSSPRIMPRAASSHAAVEAPRFSWRAHEMLP